MTPPREAAPQSGAPNDHDDSPLFIPELRKLAEAVLAESPGTRAYIDARVSLHHWLDAETALALLQRLTDAEAENASLRERLEKAEGWSETLFADAHMQAIEHGAVLLQVERRKSNGYSYDSLVEGYLDPESTRDAIIRYDAMVARGGLPMETAPDELRKRRFQANAADAAQPRASEPTENE